MSAPTTNTERETRRHAPSLVGIAIAVVIGGIMGAAITFTAIDRSDEVAADQPVMGETNDSTTN